MKKLNVALITGSDPRDRRSFSGTMFFMVEALSRHFGTVDFIGEPPPPLTRRKKIISKISGAFSGNKLQEGRPAHASKNSSKIISQRLAASHYDLIFAPVASMEISLLDTEIPIVYHSDATFRLLKGTYDAFTDSFKGDTSAENSYEQTAINRSELIIYPSDWAAASAVKDYGASKEKLRVIPYGANIDSAPPRSAVVNKSISNPLSILFLAKEWERKGGPAAYDTLRALTDRGIKAELVICGLKPPKQYRRPNVRYYKYLDKNKKKERDLMGDIIRKAHLLLLPTRADCSPTVFCEANAYGLPAFSTTVGGIPSMIENGKNGHMLSLDATGKEFADAILSYTSDKQRYRSINEGAREKYETILNWDSWGKSARKAVKDILDM